MAVSYDGYGHYKHSNVFYISRPDNNGHIEYIPIKEAKTLKNPYGLDLFYVTSDIYGTDEKRPLSRAGSVTEGMTGMKLCNKSDLDACISKYGIDKVNKLVSDFVEKHGFSPRYSCPDEDKKELFPESDVPSEPKSVLLTPLFIDGNFNCDGKRMRFMFYKTVSSVNATYNLYISASKIPDKDYPQAGNDKYLIFALVDGWIVPCNATEYDIEKTTLGHISTEKLYGDFEGREKYYSKLRANCSTQNEIEEAIKAQIQKEKEIEDGLRSDDSIKAEFLRKNFDYHISTYLEARDNNGRFPDFIGAVFVGEVENCKVLADKKRKEYEQEREARRAANAEKERIEAEEKAKKEAEEIKNAEDIFINGGTITDGRMVCTLADKYGISTPIKTRGWILNRFAKCVFDGDKITVSYWKGKSNTGSTKVYDIIVDIKAAIKEA